MSGTVREVAAGDPWGDEGPICFLGFEGGDWVWLCGQWLYDPSIMRQDLTSWFEKHPEGAWPGTVQVERLPTTGLVLAVFADADAPIGVSRVIAHKDIYYLGESHRFAGSLATLAEDLKRAFVAAQEGLRVRSL